MIYQDPVIQVEMLEHQIAKLSFNAQGTVNKFDQQTLKALSDALDATMNAQPKGLILCSAKEAFIVGADITEFLDLFSEDEPTLLTWIADANQVFNKLEDMPFPTISAVNGYALGGGCEAILATDLRIADTSARIGLPETKLGLIPGFGGTVRLPRIIGADNALEWITTGKQYRGNDALKVGAIDALVAPDQLEYAAFYMIQQAVNGELDWQRRRQQKKSPISLSKMESMMAFTTAKAMVYQVAGKHYPAPIAAVETVEQAHQYSREQALTVENKAFVTLAKTHETTALIGIFLNDQVVKSKAKAFIQLSDEMAHSAVLGAGIMGGGIAYQSASKGVPIVMKDIDSHALELGLNEASKLLNGQIRRGRSTPDKMAKVLNNITPTLDYSPVSHADIVIEAVVENPKIKSQVLTETEEHISSDTVVASNTSTISIDLLAQSLRQPERFCGMHFFNPVHRMPLVEVIKGKKTSDKTVASVVAYALKMGKTPIVVNDCPGFFVNRVLFPYFAGFNQLLADGADFIAIDKVMESQFGWPMGPAYLLDVVGLDTGYHAQSVMAEGFPDRMAAPEKDAIKLMVDNKRLGQKNGKGFYQYVLDKKGKPKKSVDEHAIQMVARLSDESVQFSPNDIIARCMIPMVIETVRCLEEGVIATAAEADMALVYGIGFPPFRGGVFRYIETMGVAEFVQLADRFTHLGPLYQVTDKMRQLAAENGHYL